MPIMASALWLISLALIGLTVLPFIRKPKWWLRAWDYPRLQLAVALGAAALLQLVAMPDGTAEYLLLAGTLAALLWQVRRIFPYTRLHRVQAVAARRIGDDQNDVSLMVVNVLQSNRNAAGMLRIMEQADPDLVIVLEADGWWDAQLAGLGQRYPHAARHPLDNTYGMLLYSRLALHEVAVSERVSEGVPSIFAVVSLRSGARFDLYAVHPEPPQPSNDVEERDAELLLIAKEVAQRKRPAIVAGDLNDVAWSHTTRLFQRISGLLDPRVGRGMFATFHAEHWLVRWPLDHIFHSADFRLRDLRVLPYFGSDHFPIYVALSHDPAAVAQQDKPDRADRTDHAEAAEKIAEGERAAAEAR